MQRLRVLLLCVALLYGAVAALANDARAQTEGGEVVEEAEIPPASPPEASVPISPPAPSVTPAQAATPAPAAQAAEKPHIAVLLPLDSPAFGKLADAVKRGIEAAASTAEPDKILPIVVYPTNDVAKSIVAIYDRALRAGAQFVIGPLTKNAVQAIAASNAVTVPTLGLSVPDSEGTLPAKMYAFGVQIEAEARQIARVAQSQGKRRAVVITGDNTLAKRASQAFMDDWTRSGRLIVDQHAYTTDQGKLKRIRDSLGPNNVDAIFLALDGQRARQVRPYIGKTVAMYGTSQINSTEGTVLGQHDLNGVVFLDMPWMVLPDHPAVMSYPRLTGVFGTFEQDRFYAIGVDAWRLAQGLLEESYGNLSPVDGVTGLLTPGITRVFVREPLPVQFLQGVPRVLDGVSLR
jgi:outer membrane PBP1 activator LpoA protein